MAWIDCREPDCAAPAEPTGPLFSMRGEGPAGPILVWFERRLCAAGHRYMVEVFEEELWDTNT